MENLGVRRNFTSVRFNEDFPRFFDSPHGKRARECKGDCEKKYPQSVHAPKHYAWRGLTKSDEGEGGDKRCKALHVEESKSNGGRQAGEGLDW